MQPIQSDKLSTIESNTQTFQATKAPPPRLWPLSALVVEVINEADEAYEACKNGRPRGPITALKRLDLKIGGALPQDALTVILGNTGSGKTAFASQIAGNCECPSAYLTTEMTAVELLRRHTARVTQTSLGQLKNGEMTPGEVGRLVNQAAQQLAHLNLIDGTTAYASGSYLLEVMEVVKGGSKHGLLVIDSLHTWARGAGVGSTEYDTLNEHLTALGRLAKQAKCSIVVICEQSRSAMEGGGVNSGAGTRFIEYCADLILDLRAKNEFDGAGEKKVALTLAKNRNGGAGEIVELQFNGALQRFKEAGK